MKSDVPARSIAVEPSVIWSQKQTVHPIVKQRPRASFCPESELQARNNMLYISSCHSQYLDNILLQIVVYRAEMTMHGKTLFWES